MGVGANRDSMLFILVLILAREYDRGSWRRRVKADQDSLGLVIFKNIKSPSTMLYIISDWEERSRGGGGG